jgi:redoxin
VGAPTVVTPTPVGAPGPSFEGLRGADGTTYSIDDFAYAQLLAIVFVSNGCPTVREYRGRLHALQDRFGGTGLQLVLVNANDPHLSPGDALSEMTRRALETGLPYPYLQDEGGHLARTLGAVCTPHAFLFDADRVLRYRGRIDDARLARNVTTRDLESAIESLTTGDAPAVAETDPFGCAIVW